MAQHLGRWRRCAATGLRVHKTHCRLQLLRQSSASPVHVFQHSRAGHRAASRLCRNGADCSRLGREYHLLPCLPELDYRPLDFRAGGNSRHFGHEQDVGELADCWIVEELLRTAPQNAGWPSSRAVTAVTERKSRRYYIGTILVFAQLRKYRKRGPR